MNRENEEKRTYKNIVFYPVKVRFYERYLTAKAAWTQRQTFLPVKYLSLPFVSAMFLWAYDGDVREDAPKQVFFGLLEMLVLACRLDTTVEELFRQGVFVGRGNGERELKKIVFTQDGEKKEITPVDFSAVRQIVAEQNGIELPNERENPELIRSYRQRIEYESRKNKSKDIRFSVEDLIETVAYLSNMRYDDLSEWTVKEFERRKRAIDRVEDRRAYRTAELSGFASFKDGNPVPSLYFDAIDDSLGTTSLENSKIAGARGKIEEQLPAQPGKA